jgi:ABC-type transport system involved in cytochrome c biogenesis permease subunit
VAESKSALTAKAYETHTSKTLVFRSLKLGKGEDMRVSNRIPGAKSLASLSIIAALAMLVALCASLIYAPTERVMGVIQRVFYFHLASAWVGFFALFVAFAVSIAYLVKRSRALDIWATASVEIGVLFCTIVLLSGSIWARPIWNASAPDHDADFVDLLRRSVGVAWFRR